MSIARTLSYPINRLRMAATGPCRLPAPLSWRMLTPDPAGRVQRAILMEYLGTGSTLGRLFDLSVVLLFWPWRTFVQAARLTWRVGGQVADVRSRPVQFIHQLYLAWFHGISPSMYYQMGIARAPKGFSPMAWLQPNQAGLLARVFRRDKGLLEINDKQLFDTVLTKANVPRLEVVATISSRQLEQPERLEELVETLDSEQELFLKPVRGNGGRGSLVLVRRGELWDGYRSVPEQSSAVLSLDAHELVRRLTARAPGLSWLLQRRSKNHPEVRAVFGEALVCIRVVTGICGDNVIPLGSVLCFGVGNSIVSQGGLTVAIAQKTGRLGRPFHSTESQEFFSRNPDNGAMIEGMKLPDWSALMETVAAAHREFPDFPFLGWDMALSDKGPLVIEANGNFGTGAMQKPGPRPMIDEHFLAVFHYWQTSTGVAV